MTVSTLTAIGVSHAYGSVPVLRDADFELSSGTIHALVGQNGSGKSTLIKVLTGAVRPTRGRIELDGVEISLASTAAALGAGIGVVHQHYHLFPDLSVADNVIGVQVAPPRRRTGSVDRRRVNARVERLFDELGLAIRPRTLAGRLDAAERKFVEIARALLLQPRFLILDEPTASMQPAEARRVLDLIGRVKDRGVGLAFVSHRIGEVLAVADRVTVLRDGRVVATYGKAVTERDIARGIVGAEQDPLSGRAATPRRIVDPRDVAIAMSARGVERIEVARCEIVGMAGLVGSGASAAVQRLAGLGNDEGWLEVGGKRVDCRSPRDAAKHRIGFIPEDRTIRGVIGDLSVSLNIALSSLDTVSSRRGIISRRALDDQARRYQHQLSIKLPSTDAPVRALSGGNQQKVLLSRWVASGVRVLAVDEPTHGVDIGAKPQIHDALRTFAADGGAVVVASAEPAELVALCDRIVVWSHGRVTAVLASADLDSEAGGDTNRAARLLEAMFGGAKRSEVRDELGEG